MDKAKHDQIIGIIDPTDDMTIATNRSDGFPQATTVSYVNDGLSIYFGTGSGSQKAQNIAADNRVSLTINRPYDTWDDIVGLSMGGHAVAVTDADEIKKITGLLTRKFPQVFDYQPESKGLEDLALFRIDPVVISVLDYTKGFGHCELVTV